MVFVDKGQPPKGGKYLMCDNGRRGVKLTKEVDGEAVKFKCRAHSVRYEEFQDTMLNNLSKLRPQTVLPHANEQTQQTKILRNAIRGLDGEITNASEQIENFTDQVGRTRDAEMRTAYEERISKLKVHRKELETDKAAKESELRDLNRGQQSFERWQVNLDGLKKAISKDVETRIRLKAHLKEFVNRVDVFAKGHEDNVEHAEELVEEYMPELKREESYPAFRSYQRKRLLSPDGRFYRLHLKITRPNRDNGEIARNGRKYAPYRPDDDGLQIAPISSLSARVSIQPGKDGWRFSGPALDKLLKEFSDGRKPDRFVPKGSVSAKTANS
jgi:hypothetical protein